VINSIRPAPHVSTYRYRWLLIVPFIWQALLASAVNDVAFRPFGVPFPMVWQMAGIVVTSMVIGLVFHLDQRNSVEQEEAAFLAATSASSGVHQ
jgi:hypothetical protein